MEKLEKLEKIMDTVKNNDFKLNELLHKQEIQEQEEKKTNILIWILAVIGIAVAIGAIVYVVYRYFHPSYLDDFDDEFEDDTEDEDDDEDFFENEK